LGLFGWAEQVVGDLFAGGGETVGDFERQESCLFFRVASGGFYGGSYQIVVFSVPVFELAGDFGTHVLGGFGRGHAESHGAAVEPADCTQQPCGYREEVATDLGGVLAVFSRGLYNHLFSVACGVVEDVVPGCVMRVGHVHHSCEADAPGN